MFPAVEGSLRNSQGMTYRSLIADGKGRDKDEAKDRTGRSGLGKHCYFCKGTGHSSREFPKKVCKLCNSLGHLANNCPSEPVSATATSGGTVDSSKNIFDAFMERGTVVGVTRKGVSVFGWIEYAGVTGFIQDCDFAFGPTRVNSRRVSWVIRVGSRFG